MSALARLQALLSTGRGLLIVLLLLALGLVVIGGLRIRGRQVAAALLAGGSLLVAVAVTLGLTLRPTVLPVDAVPTLYFDPFEGIRAAAHRHIVWGPVIDNVALFVPIGALGSAVCWRRRAVLAWLGSVLLSVAIEAVQFLAPLGRIANTADVLANAVGAGLGVGLAAVLGAGRPPRTHPRGRSRLSRV